MGHIFYLMGKSSTGKDTLYKKLLKDPRLKLNRLVTYTTRPIRIGEHDGVEYHFVDREQYEEMRKADRIIESRVYHTYMGDWIYYTARDEEVDPKNKDYIIIGTLEAYMKVRDCYGADVVVPILIELDDGERLYRAFRREKHQKVPKYEEMCRRFLADQEDFADDKIEAAGITRRFENKELFECYEEIKKYIVQWMEG